MILCKYCCGKNYVKNGIVKKKQRFLCRDCNRTFREGDNREKYSNDKRLKVIRSYLEGVGIMAIERLENVPNPLIIKWIRNISNIMRKILNETKIPEEAKDIQILELDELFSYVQKKHKKSTCGLLLIGSEIKLLTLK